MDVSIGYLFKQIHIKFEKKRNHDLASENLTQSQIDLLGFLMDCKSDKVTQKDIAEGMEIQHTTVIGTLKRLEEKGLVRSVVDSENKKYRNILLTPAAMKVEDRIRRHRNETEALIVKDLSEEEIHQLRRLLVRVRDNISDVR